MGELIKGLLQKLEGWLDSFVLLTPNIVVALLVLVLFAIVAKFASRIAYRLLSRFSSHSALNSLARKLARVVITMVGVLVSLHILHLDKAATTFLAGAGIVGIAIGFAFQDMSANFISGIAMAFKRPLEIGELVETNDFLGIVESIELRSTVIKTLDGQQARIPNRQIFQKALVNLSKHKTRRVDVTVGVAYCDDLEHVKNTAMKAIASLDRDTSREPEIFFTGFGASSIDLVARFWIDYEAHTDYLCAKSNAIIGIKTAFDAESISIPFPIRTLEFSTDSAVREHLNTLSDVRTTNGVVPAA